MDFTIGIPVFNEESILVENIQKLCAYAGRLGRYELLIGSNGSTDRTVELARQLAAANPAIRVFEIPEKKVGTVFRIFLQEAGSEFLVSLDMDLSTDLDFLPQSLKLMETNDLVIGSKKLGNQRRSLIRRVGSGLYIYAAQKLLCLGAEDFSMGAKVYRVSFFKALGSRLGDKTTYVVNAIYWARRKGARVTEIPVFCNDSRRSRFSLVREALDKYSHLVGLWRSDVAMRRSEVAHHSHPPLMTKGAARYHR